VPLHQHEEEQETGHREPLLRVGMLIDVSGLIVEELPECRGGEGRNWGMSRHRGSIQATTETGATPAVGDGRGIELSAGASLKIKGASLPSAR